MAEAIKKEEEHFTCPVCRDLLKDPVTIPCGHNFCMRCIEGCWDQEDQKGVCSCPLCKRTFTPRPTLYKNPLIAEMVETFMKRPLCTTDRQTDKQRQLGQTQWRFQLKIRERENELQELRKAVKTLKSSAQTAVEDSEKIFTEMIYSIEIRCSEVKELIRAQEKAEVSRAEGLLKQLEQEIAELKRRDVELEQLSHKEDCIPFPKNFPSIRDSPRSKDLPSMTSNQSFSFEAVKESVSGLKGQLDDIFGLEVVRISAAVQKIQIIQSLEYADPELPVRRTNSSELLPPSMGGWRPLPKRV